MTSIQPDLKMIYHIRIKGNLSPSLTAWFGELTILSQENNETLVAGEFADQSALRGFLDQLWNLNFTILSIKRIDK